MTPLPLFAAFIAGVCLGAVYFAILWASVRRLTAGAPARTLAFSAILRMALIIGAVTGALALGLGAAYLLPAGLGFFAARLAATRLIRPKTEEPR